MAWLTGWSYRKSVTASRAAGAVTNYQMKVLVGESAGATGEDVDCESHIESDFRSLRFTASDGETLLDYWIEQITGTTPNQLATVWVELDSIGTGATTFYMYYGNSGASDAASGANTFIVFDDFERGANGDAVGGSWTVLAGTVEISTEQAWGGTRSAKWKGAATAASGEIPVAASDNIAIAYRMYKEDATYAWQMQGNGTKRWALLSEVDEDIMYYGAPTDSLVNATPDAWDLYELRDFVWGTPIFDIVFNDSVAVNGGTIGITDGLVVDLLRFIGASGAGLDFWIDNVRVRNFRTVEPAWGSWAAEESAPAAGGVPLFHHQLSMLRAS